MRGIGGRSASVEVRRPADPSSGRLAIVAGLRQNPTR
jgi:hypothetical protein